MKPIYTLLLLFVFTATASAGLVADIEPSPYSVSISRVEQAQKIMQEGNIRINLIQVDNGGSTDVSSIFLPSSLYLTVFVQGEEYDLSSRYEIFNNIVKLYDVQFQDTGETATFLAEVIDHSHEGFSPKTILKREKLYLGDILKEAREFSSENLKASLGIQSIPLN